MNGHLYYHAPCFDGTISAVLLGDFFEAKLRWDEFELHAVNYDLKKQWLTSNLHKPAIVVDFLFHPDAYFWADHHETTFLDETHKAEYQRRQDPYRVYEQSAKSCASLLWRHFHEEFLYRNQNFEELVYWADKTDSADYESVHEAVFGDAPALRIYRILDSRAPSEFCASLVRKLRIKSLEEVARLPDVAERYEQIKTDTEAGIERFRIGESIFMHNDRYAVFDVDATDVKINRYAPFVRCPQAWYSIGIERWERQGKQGATIRAMRNPWIDFRCASLGIIFEEFGGGGHQRIGAVVLRAMKEPDPIHIRDKILARIKDEDRKLASGVMGT